MRGRAAARRGRAAQRKQDCPTLPPPLPSDHSLSLSLALPGFVKQPHPSNSHVRCVPRAPGQRQRLASAERRPAGSVAEALTVPPLAAPSDLFSALVRPVVLPFAAFPCIWPISRSLALDNTLAAPISCTNTPSSARIPTLEGDFGVQIKGLVRPRLTPTAASSPVSYPLSSLARPWRAHHLPPSSSSPWADLDHEIGRSRGAVGSARGSPGRAGTSAEALLA